MSEIRYDRISDAHVIMAPERLRRPDFSTEPIAEENDTVCPFCEGNESMTPPEIFALRRSGTFANEKGWKTRVIPNLYKAVQIESPNTHHFGLFEYWDGFGAHEVLIDTPLHRTSMAEWSIEEVSDWFKTLRQRVSDLRRDNRIAYISLFKNEGIHAGSTQSHSHTQIIGLPIIPKVEHGRYQRKFEYFKATGKALMESVLRQEEEEGERIVAKEGEFTAFCPYASAYPFEVVISSKKPVGQIDTLSDESIEKLAPLLLLTLKKLKLQLGTLHFNLWISTSPLQEGAVEHDMYASIHECFRFSLRIMPRIYRYGGFEAGTGMIINPVLPELAAKFLREGSNV